MIVERVPQSNIRPFSLPDIKEHVRVTSFEEEFLLGSYGDSAALELEAYAQIALLDQLIRVTLESWPRSTTFNLPIAPMVDPLSVSITADGEPFAGYATITGLRPAVRVTDATKPCGVIVIEYTAGFGPNANDIPADLAIAIQDQAATFFDMRGEPEGKTNGMSAHMARITARYRRVAL